MNEHIRWVAIKLAVFTVVTIIVTVWLAAVIGNLRIGSQPYQIEAEFTDASGLLVGDVVKAAGVTVGRVSDIRVDDGLAIVTLSIDEGVELPAELSAEIRFRNLVGQRMVALVDDSDAGGYTRGGDLITLDRTSPAFDLSALFNGLRPLIRSTDPHDINIVARSLTRALSGRARDVETILGNVADLADTISARDDDLTALLDGLGTVTEDLAGRDVQLRQTLADLDTFLTATAAARSDLSAALVSLDSATVRLRRIVAANDDNIRSELRDLATILDAVDDKRRRLRSVVRGLPEMLIAIERATGYGQWANIHLVDVCKDDLGTCGRRGDR